MQVSTGRLSESDGMDGAAIDGRFNESEKGAMLGAYGSSRRMSTASAVGGEVMAARARAGYRGGGRGRSGRERGQQESAEERN